MAREHGVSRGAIRTAVADLLPNQPEKPTATTEPETVIVEMPGKIARHLQGRDDLEEAQRHALRQGRTVRRGQGYSLHVIATRPSSPEAATKCKVLCSCWSQRCSRAPEGGIYALMSLESQACDQR